MPRLVSATVVLVVPAVLALAGCGRTLGTEDFATDQPTGHASLGERPSGKPPATSLDLSAPPALTLHRPEGDVALTAYSYCWMDGSGTSSGSAGCADGGPADDLPTTAADGEVGFSFPLDGWAFNASFLPTGWHGQCAPSRQTALERGPDGTYVVPALGPAGSWDVSVTGYGDTGNDLATSFRWTTQTDSTHITPATGTVGFMGPPMERDDPVVAFGPSLLLSGLPDEAADPVAELVLPDAPGAPSYPMDLRPDQCRHDGVLDFEGRTKAGDEVDLPPLGDPPYRTEVRVTLAGTTYVGTASWPEDLQPRNSNSLQLHWSPPLPTGF